MGALSSSAGTGPIGVRKLAEVDAQQLAAIVTQLTPEAIAWLGAAARQGIPRAQAILGQRLLFAQGCARDAHQAVHWLALAAQADDLDAVNLMGRCCENGWGRPRDTQMAVYWYRLAAARGLDWAMYNLANLMMNGDGTAPDRAGALALYRRAATLGHSKSINVLGRFFEEGWEVGEDAEQAFALYRQAALGGDFRGQFNYARLLLQRGWVEQSLAWLRCIPRSATPAFLCNVRHWLMRSGHATLRALADEPGWQEIYP